jgi:zinc transport system substrate-binding protein
MSRAALPAPALAVVVVVATALATALGGCASSSSDSRPTVVTSFYPLQFVVEQLAGDRVRVLNLTAPGVEPHDLELKPRQVAELADADLVVYESKLQPAVDDAVKQNASDHALDVADAVDLQDSNLHFWLDPVRLATAATAIEKRLVRVDPGDRSALAGNLARLLDTLSTLDHEFATGLSRCVRDVIVTSHSAFGYWSRYGVRTEAIAGLSPDAEPSASRLDELRSLVERDHLTTVFSETLASPKTAEVLARDLGVSTAVLDPIEGLAAGSTADYVSIMRANLAALQKANGCTVNP